MKSSLVRRVSTSIVLAGLIASCGGGSESSDTTERTRNAASTWVPTATPNKVLVFGSQDGLIQSVTVPASSEKVEPVVIATIAPGTMYSNTLSGVAVDTARSQVIFSGSNSSNEAFLSRINLDGTDEQQIFATPGGFSYGMGYDPSSRIAVPLFSQAGAPRHILHSVDDINAPLLNKFQAFYSIPLYDGSRTLITTNEYVREVSISDFSVDVSSSKAISAPFDLWAIAEDTLSDIVYGARQQAGNIVAVDLSGIASESKVEAVNTPASIAVFSDGTIATGAGQAPNRFAAVAGEITVSDPTGASPQIVISGLDRGASLTGVQSLWAVESPIATAPPTVSDDGSGVLTCSDATWRGDLPLSRLSRSPIASSRSYAWFKDGVRIFDAPYETHRATELGAYSCAVMSANYAGGGNSPESDPVKVTSIPTTTVASFPTDSSASTIAPTDSVAATTTTIGSTGGSESSVGGSPVVAVPVISPSEPVVVVTPTLRSAKWTFKGRTAKITFKKWSGASKYRFYVRGATRKNIVCKTAKTTVTCTTTSLKKGLNTFSAKALSRSGITLALSTKTRNTK